MALLEIRDLHVSVKSEGRVIPVVKGVSFEVDVGETVGIVGESGCGKSLTSLAIMGLLEGSQASVTGGTILFEGRDLAEMSAQERRLIMGSRMAMIFQEPMTSLNPVYRIGDQLAETIRQHRRMSKREARTQVIGLLDMVRIPDPDYRIDSYPHQMSGGQRQRVMIANAIACDPKLLIADEPTTALDVTVQKEILNLILELRERTGTSIVLISHDLGVIAETCTKVAVMYSGRFVESAPVDTLFSNVNHPYTRGLMDSLPATDREVEWLSAIPGRVPSIGQHLDGCAFHPRCPLATDLCRKNDPAFHRAASKHLIRCHYAEGIQHE